MKKSANIFIILAIFMIGFGIVIGVLFPFLIRPMGVFANGASSPLFFVLCILAGVVVGAANFILCVVIVQKRLKKVSGSMIKVENNLQTYIGENIEDFRTTDGCYIKDKSNDEFGKCAHAFNQLLSAFEQSLITHNVIRKYSRVLNSELEINSLTTRALKKILNHTQTNYGAVFVFKDEKLEPTAVEGIKNADDLTENSHVLSAIESKRTEIIDLPENVIVDVLLADIKPCCIVVEPLIYKDTVLGVIILASINHQTQNLNYLDLFSSNLALALNNSIKHSQLQALVAIDPLTGVYNRRFGFVRMEEEYSASVRSGDPIGLLMLDIDHFKQINDTYGHIAGDKVLTDISKMMKDILRNHDILIRYGGEEFIAVLPGAGTQDARVAAERIRKHIEQNFIEYAETQIPITVSIGVASYPDTDVKKLEDLIKFADEAMYNSKLSGRNRVSVYKTRVLGKVL